MPVFTESMKQSLKDQVQATEFTINEPIGRKEGSIIERDCSVGRTTSHELMFTSLNDGIKTVLI